MEKNKQFQEGCSINEPQNNIPPKSMLSKFIEQLPSILALLSLVFSIVSFSWSSINNKKINSIEHEISENFKADFLELVTTLHSIKDKILTIKENDISDIVPECEKLADIRLRSGYFLMMYSFKDQQEMVTFNDKLQEIINLKTHFENTRLDEGKSHYADTIADLFNLLLKNIDNTSNVKFNDFNQIKFFIEQNLINLDSGNELDGGDD